MKQIIKEFIKFRNELARMDQHLRDLQYGPKIDTMGIEENEEKKKKMCIVIFIFACILSAGIIGIIVALDMNIPYVGDPWETTHDVSIYSIIFYLFVIGCVTLIWRIRICGIFFLFPLILLFLYFVSIYTHLESYFYLGVITVIVIFFFVLKYTISNSEYEKEWITLLEGLRGDSYGDY